MLERRDNTWIGDTWDELGLDLKGKDSKSNNIKLNDCPACKEIGKGFKDYSVSLKPSDGYGHCFKCGTVFLIRKEEFVSGPSKKGEYKPPVVQNVTALSDKGLAFFRSRMISQEAINVLRIMESEGFVCFPYFFKGELVNVKYRGIAEKHSDSLVAGCTSCITTTVY